MEDGPTMIKLIVLMISMMILYIIFILPIMKGSYSVVTGGDFNTLGSFMNKNLKLIY